MTLSALQHKQPAQDYDTSYSGFCLFRIPKKGGRVIWEITNTCNYACRYCIFSSTSRQQKDELDTEQAFRVIDDMQESGFTHIKITGGEPFMRPDIMDIMRYINKNGMKTDISTNAAYITPDMAKELATLGLEMVHVSLDGHTQELQETVRGKKTYSPTIIGLQALAQENIYIRIGCILYKDNQNSLRDISGFCNELGASEVIFSLMEPLGRMKKGKQLHLLCDRDVDDIKSEIQTLAKEYEGKIQVKGNFADKSETKKCGSCPGAEKFLFVDHKGRVSPCTWVAESAPQYIADKTLHTHSLKEILVGDQISDFRNHVTALSASRLDSCPVQDMKAFSATEKVSALFKGDFEKNIAAQPYFSETGQIYATTTENIASSFVGFDLKDKTVLTVCGSGDQILNAISLDASEIVSFDINILAGYFSALKKSSAQTLDYKNFCSFIMDDFDFETYTSLRSTLPYDACFFWDKAYAAFDNDGKLLRQSVLFRDEPKIFTPDTDDLSRAKRNNTYLSSLELFRKAQGYNPIEHLSLDVQKITQGVKGRSFDFIWLSNISDYAHKMFSGDYLTQYREQIVMPLLDHLNQGGSLVFGYVYDAQDKNDSSTRSDINIKENRQRAFSPPTGIIYSEKEVPGAIEASNPDTLLIWQKK